MDTCQTLIKLLASLSFLFLFLTVFTYPYGCSERFGGSCYSFNEKNVKIIKSDYLHDKEKCIVKGQFAKSNNKFITCTVNDPFLHGAYCEIYADRYYSIGNREDMYVGSLSLACYNKNQVHWYSVLGFSFLLCFFACVVLIIVCTFSEQIIEQCRKCYWWHGGQHVNVQSHDRGVKLSTFPPRCQKCSSESSSSAMMTSTATFSPLPTADIEQM